MTLLASLYTFDANKYYILALFYTDPGSGALVWQLVLASFFGALFYARSFTRKITARLSSKRDRKQNRQNSTSNTSNQDRLG